MTAYCSAQDIRRALVGSGPNTGTNTAADLDDESLDDAAEEATSVVDAFLDGPYDTEVDTIPATVKFWTRDIGAYLATLTWRKAKSPAANDPVVLRYNHAMDMLKGVQTGSILIPTPENEEDQPSVVNQYTGNLFTARNFDLTGRQEDLSGWPLFVSGGVIFWPGFPE